MPTYDCPRALTEPPTCDGSGSLRFDVHGPEYDTNAGPQPECTEKDCTCELTEEEWAALDEAAAKSWYEYE